MKRLMRSIEALLLGALVVAIVGGLGLTGCSKLSNPVGPGATSEPRILQMNHPPNGSADFLPFYVRQYVFYWMGGTVGLPFFAQVCIPPYALTRSTYISMYVPNTGYLQVDLGPDGTVFNTPATLTMWYAESNYQDQNALTICLQDPVSLAWSPLATTVDTTAQTMKTQLQHFSRYAGAED